MKKFDKFLPKNLKNGQIIREPSQITFAVRGGQVVSKMLTYVYIGSVGPFENVYINKKKIVNIQILLNAGANIKKKNFPMSKITSMGINNPFQRKMRQNCDRQKQQISFSDRSQESWRTANKVSMIKSFKDKFDKSIFLATTRHFEMNSYFFKCLKTR